MLLKIISHANKAALIFVVVIFVVEQSRKKLENGAVTLIIRGSQHYLSVMFCIFFWSFKPRHSPFYFYLAKHN